MRDVLIPLAITTPVVASQIQDHAKDADTWWKLIEKNGLGFVFFVLFVALSILSYFREKKVERERSNKETAANKERLDMQKQIRDLSQAQLTASEEHGKRQLAQATAHARKLESVIEEGNKVQVELSASIKQLHKRVNCPAVHS